MYVHLVIGGTLDVHLVEYLEVHQMYVHLVVIGVTLDVESLEVHQMCLVESLAYKSITYTYTGYCSFQPSRCCMLV